jgi:hypothetical protein
MSNHKVHIQDIFPDNFKNQKGGIAAAQTFETIFYLIGSGRWVAVITSMASCIELFLRAKHDEVDDSSSGLQKQMRKFEAHTDEGKKEILISQGEELRLLRNRIVHNGFSPKDDPEAISITFLSGWNYLEAVIEYSIGLETSFKDYLLDNQDIKWSQWFWSNFYHSREVLLAKKNKSLAIGSGSVFIMQESCFKMIKQQGIIHRYLVVQDTYRTKIIEMASQGSEIQFLFDQENKKDIEESLNDKELFQLEQDCPVCFEDGIWASIGLNAELSIKIKGLGCLQCIYSITDQEILEIFFKDKLEVAEILKFKSELGI